MSLDGLNNWFTRYIVPIPIRPTVGRDTTICTIRCALTGVGLLGQGRVNTTCK
jgi:hypothetical protein